MKKIIALLLVFCMCLSVVACSSNSSGKSTSDADWPKKDITIIVPYAAGGSTDLNVRALSEQLTKSLGVNIVVLNKEGGGGSVGAAECALASPDGYTYTVANGANMSVVPRSSNIGYTFESFEPVSQLSVTPLALAVNKDFPANNLEEFIAWAKEHDGDLRFTSAGANSTQQLTMDILSKQEGFKATHVVGNGAGAAVASCMGGHVEAVVALTTDLLSAHQSGELKILCVFADERVKDFDDVPCSKELGYDNLSFGVWYAIVGPKGIPAEIVKKFDEAIKNALDSTEVTDAYAKLGINKYYLNCADLKVKMQEIDKMFGEVLQTVK